jgi:tetratricopeptide (TPR) repeat protein
MKRNRLLFVLGALLTAALAAQNVPASKGARPQVPPADAPIQAQLADQAQAYYYYTVGHFYADLAAQAGFRGDNVNKAIDNLRLAVKTDPSAGFIAEELADVYLQSARFNEAITESEAALRANPNDLNARRILGRVYTRMLSDQRSNRVDRSNLRKAIEQFEKITQLAPNDIDAWNMLGRLYKVDESSTESEAAYRRVLSLDPENEDALTGLAMAYADQGDTQRAAETLERVTKKNPSMRSLMALAQTYEEMRDYTKAALALERAYQASNGNPEILRGLAQNYLMAGQYDEALAAYTTLTEEDPKDAGSWLRLSQLHRQKRDLVKARAAQDQAAAADPNGFEVRYNEVNLLEAEGRIPDAIALLEKLLSSANARGTNDLGARNFRVALLERLGSLRVEQKEFDAARKVFREAAQFDPNSAPRFIALIAESFRQEKNFPEALREIDEAKRFYPENPAVARARATVLVDLARYDEAAAELRPLLRKSPEDREIHLAIAQVFERKKDYAAQDAALAEAEKLSESKEEKLAVYFFRGAALERQKNFDQAEAEFRKVLELDANNAAALNYLGYMLADRNLRLNEAKDLISKALELDPDNGAYLDSLGWVYYRQQKYEDAERLLRQAMRRYSGDPTIYDHLGDVYWATGRVQDAVNQWEQALREWAKSAESEKDPALIAQVEKKLETARVKLAEAKPSVRQP